MSDKERVGYKICGTCGKEKLLSQYHKGKGKRLGTQSACKICKNTYDRLKAKEPAKRVKRAIADRKRSTGTVENRAREDKILKKV